MYESGENYLETILMLHQKQGYVRSIDIANELGFTKPSVSRAMSILKNDGYIVYPRGTCRTRRLPYRTHYQSRNI